MELENKGLGIIFHSDSYDRIYHGLSFALAALALGRKVKLFFSYWALGYLKKKETPELKLDSRTGKHKEIIEKNIKAGHLQNIDEVIRQAKAMGAQIYACSSSMGILNIARDELIKDVDKSMGITTFLTETTGDQILFI